MIECLQSPVSLELPLVKTRIVDDGPVAYCLTVSYTSGMTLHGIKRPIEGEDDNERIREVLIE